MIQKRVKTKTKKTNASVRHEQPAQLTFLDHVRELQGRLFAIVIVFLLISVSVFPFFDKIVAVIVAPLGKQNELVYLTPGGAFTFMMQVCLYVGLIGSLPVIIYHLYRFIMPAVQKVRLGKVVAFTFASLLLAVVGIVFAYTVSLPAAIQFLTGFNLAHINPMLTIDSYLSFVMTYLLAGALLFQLPLIILIIDSIRPLKPGHMMKQQGKILLFSYIIAAVITPTPDAINQTLVASPIVVMYQIGIVMIWFKRHSRRSRKIRFAQEKLAPASTLSRDIATAPLSAYAAPRAQGPLPTHPIRSLAPQSAHRTVDGIIRPVKSPTIRPSLTSPGASQNSSAIAAPHPRANRRSVDGVIRYNTGTVAVSGSLS